MQLQQGQANFASQSFSDRPAIRTIELSKRFKKMLAVNNVSFEVQTGDVFGLLGPNGAGKTTIIRMLLGLIKPTGGKAEVFGFDPVTERAEVFRRVGAIVEAPALYPKLNGRDNLRAMAIASGITNPESKIDEVLQIMGLAARSKDKFSTYSLGMKQRLCIAATLLTDPQLIILDEPTNGLDPAGMAEIRQLIKDLAAQGRTVFLSSHLLHEVQQVCNRVAVIQRGQIIVQGLVNDLLAGKSAIWVRVQADEWENAWHILQRGGWENRVRGESGYLILNVPGSEGRAINQALASNGIYASEISVQSQSLEEYYLNLTNSQPQPDNQFVNAGKQQKRGSRNGN